jgi:hypothetical protein
MITIATQHEIALSGALIPADVAFFDSPYHVSSIPRSGACNHLQPSERSGCAICGMAAKGRPDMATLASLQGNGGGRIPMGSFSYDVSRHDLTRIIESMPTETCRQMHIAARQGDTATAQRLIREAATAYYASAPAAPAGAPMAPCISRTSKTHAIRRKPRS